jgi:hypothetical protein
MITVSLNLEPCPASGDGVHSWLYYAACRAVEVGMTDEQAVEIIESMMTRPPNPAREVEDALNAARGERSGPSVLWPQANDEQIEAIAHDGMRVVDFWEASPFRMRAGASRAEEAIDVLFPGNRGSALAGVRECFARGGVNSGAGDWVNIH